MSNQKNQVESKNITEITDRSEKLGAIGSPSSTTQLTIDIFGTAVNKKLLGELGVLRYSQEGVDHYALGQITEVLLKNRLLEQAIGRGIVRVRERWDAVQEKQDTHTATMNISAVFSVASDKIEPSILGTVPPTGTSICIAEDDLLDAVLKPSKNELFYLGKVFGSKPSLPMWFKHFGFGDRGAGEAYHIGVFGRTGSGKSVLAQMLMLAYSRHREMGIFVLDPQGEFSKFMKQKYTLENIHMSRIINPLTLNMLKRPYVVIGVQDLILDRWEIFSETLVRLGMFRDLGIKKGEYQELMADYVEDSLKGDVTLKELHKEASLEKALRTVIKTADKVYAQDKSVERVKNLTNQVLDEPQSDIGRRIRKSWNQASSLFKTRPDAKTIRSIVDDALTLESSQSRKIVFIDLSKSVQQIPADIWNKHIKPLLIDRFLRALIERAEEKWDEDSSLNTLVVIDESHRLAPRERFRSERWNAIKSRLIDAVRTTRKFGLGWLFISQTLSSLDRDIVNQLRSSFFGFGLGSGSELQALRELVGGDREYLKLYQSFKDPHSAFSEEHRTYSFMAIGPVSPLAFSGAPLFFDAFTNAKMFLNKNGIHLTRTTK